MRNKRSISIFILIVLIISLFIPITAIATNEDTQILKDGTYKIKAAVGSDMYLDIDAGSKANGANLQIWSKSDVEQLQFKLTYLNGNMQVTIQMHNNG